ncbi:MAG: hypothetical protein AAB110_07335 [Candidatus Desantisbacteria bacterium]
MEAESVVPLEESQPCPKETWPVPPEPTASAVPRVRTPVDEKLEVALPPKYAVPTFENRVEEAFPVSVRLAKFAVPVNVGLAERTPLPVPVEVVTPVPPEATARAEARVSEPREAVLALRVVEVAVPKYPVPETVSAVDEAYGNVEAMVVEVAVT